MVWLSRLLLIVLVFSLVTGRAYFVRGFVSKQNNPRLYWKLIAFYLIMTSMLFVKLTVPYVEHYFSDTATRAAREIEMGAVRLRQARLNTTTLSLELQARPKGCTEDYIFQVDTSSSVTIWCKSEGQVTSTYTTTGHLKSVLVTQLLKIEKKKGELLFIELQLQNVLQKGIPSDFVAVVSLH